MEESLTLNQKLQIELLKRQLSELPREDLEKYLIKALQLKFYYYNNCAKLMKKELGIDEIKNNCRRDYEQQS